MRQVSAPNAAGWSLCADPRRLREAAGPAWREQPQQRARRHRQPVRPLAPARPSPQMHGAHRRAVQKSPERLHRSIIAHARERVVRIGGGECAVELRRR